MDIPPSRYDSVDPVWWGAWWRHWGSVLDPPGCVLAWAGMEAWMESARIHWSSCFAAGRSHLYRARSAYPETAVL